MLRKQQTEAGLIICEETLFGGSNDIHITCRCGLLDSRPAIFAGYDNDDAVRAFLLIGSGCLIYISSQRSV